MSQDLEKALVRVNTTAQLSFQSVSSVWRFGQLSVKFCIRHEDLLGQYRGHPIAVYNAKSIGTIEREDGTTIIMEPKGPPAVVHTGCWWQNLAPRIRLSTSTQATGHATMLIAERLVAVRKAHKRSGEQVLENTNFAKLAPSSNDYALSASWR